MPEEICQNCKYFDDGAKECHFNPPTIIETNDKTYINDHIYHQSVMGVFPKVYITDWCGKFKLAECLLDKQE